MTVIEGEQLHRLLNQYRSAEIRGAGVILRLGRLCDTSELRSNFTKHLRDEGVHAWMWARALNDLGWDIEDVEDPYQQKLGSAFGMPRTVEDLLALTLVSERRGVASYEEHLGMADNPKVVDQTLRAILKDERWHVDWIADELMRRAEDAPGVAEALARAEQADLDVTAQLRSDMGL